MGQYPRRNNMKKIVKPLVGALLAAAMLSSSVTVGAGTVTGTIERAGCRREHVTDHGGR